MLPEELESLKKGWFNQEQKEHPQETERLEEETKGASVAYITRRMLKNLKIKLEPIEVETPKKQAKKKVTVKHRKKKGERKAGKKKQ